MDLYSSLQGDRPTMSLADMISDDQINKSFSSAISAASGGSGGSSSSKAVLAALRALQDKIRRLETERSQALDEASQLRLQLKNQEIEHEHSKQREQLTAQKSLQEARSAFERMTSDKQELELKLAKLEDKNRSLQSQSEELQLRIRQLEDEKHNGGNRLRDLENHQAVLEQQIRLAQQREKDAAETILWESRRHEEELQNLQQRVRQLQVELSEASALKGSHEAKVLELDGLVAQLLALNEALVAQLSGRPVRLATASSTKKKKKKVVSDKPPRAANVATVASDAARTTKYTARSPAQLIPVKSDDVENLKAMHKLYASMAKNLRKGSPKRASTGSPKKVATRMSSKKSALGSSSSMTAGSLEHSYAESRHGTGDADSYLHSMNRSAEAAGNNALPSPPTSPLRKEVRLPRPVPDSDASESYLRASSASQHAQSSASASANRQDMQAVIHGLEEEFDALNRQYRQLLSGVQATNHYHDGDFSNAEKIQAQAEEIVNVIQKLHQKGEQLRLLKSPR